MLGVTGDHWRHSGITEEDGSSDWPADGNECPAGRSRRVAESVRREFRDRGGVDQLPRVIHRVDAIK